MANTELNIVLKAIDQASPQLKGIGNALKGLAGGLVGIEALRQGFDFLTESINQAAEKESAINKLKTVIENTGISFDSVRDSVLGYANSLESATLYTDEQAINGMRQLIGFGLSVEQTQKAIASAMDLATAKGMDLDTAINLIGKAYQGHTETLARYGIVAKDVNDLMGQINDKFGGAATAQLNTYEGQINTLNDSMRQFKEGIGSLLTDALLPMLISLNINIDANQKMAESLKDIAKQEEKNKDDFINAQLERMRANQQFTFDAEAGTQARMVLLQQEIQLGLWGSEARMNANKIAVENAIALDNLELQIKEMNLKKYEQLYKYSDMVVQTLATGSAEEQKALFWTILEDFLLAESKKHAALALTALLTLDFGKAALEAGAALALGGLGGAAHKEEQRILNEAKTNQANELIKLNQDYLNNQNNITTTATNGVGNIKPISSSVIERSASPTYNTYNSQYNIQAGIILGDESVIDSLFKKLMERYEYSKKLQVA